MTQTLNPPTTGRHEAASIRSLMSQKRMLALHGWDPLSEIPATWHVTSLADDGASGTYLIERAEGDIHSPALWMQAKRDAAIVDEAGVLDLVRSVMLSGGS